MNNTIEGLNAEYLYIVKRGNYSARYTKPNDKHVRIKLNSNLIVHLISDLRQGKSVAVIEYKAEKGLNLKRKANSFASPMVRIGDKRKSLMFTGTRESTETVAIACVNESDFLKNIIKAQASSDEVNVYNYPKVCPCTLYSYEMEI